MGTDIYKYRLIRSRNPVYKHLLYKEKVESKKSYRNVYISKRFKSIDLDPETYNRSYNFWKFRIWLSEIDYSPEIVPTAIWDFRSIFEDHKLDYDQYVYVSNCIDVISKDDINNIHVISKFYKGDWLAVFEAKCSNTNPKYVIVNMDNKDLEQKYVFYEDREVIFVEEIDYQRKGIKRYEEHKSFFTPKNLGCFKSIVDENSKAYNWCLEKDEFIYASW